MSIHTIAATPVGFPGARVLHAAATAGFRGFLSLEDGNQSESAVASLESLAASDTSFGVSLPNLRCPAGVLVSRVYGRGLQFVVLSDAESPHLDEDLAVLRSFGISVWLQVTKAEGCKRASQAGVDAIVLKGNEAGGAVGEETSYILLQRAVQNTSLPLYVRGGIGLRSAAGCLAAGATGIVLDWQLALCAESELPLDVRAKVSRMDGSETSILGQDWECRFRAYSRPGEAAFAEIRELGERSGLHRESAPAQIEAWKQELLSRVRSRELLLIGQDAAIAAELSEKYWTVASICRAIQHEASRQCRVAARLNVLREGGPLATSQGIRYPIAQGPMTRVSDRAEFAFAVSDAGALPFLALALMRGPEVAALLAETATKLGKLPWGVGILGFVPKELRDEQLKEVLRLRPPFAVIAGGRPDQAKVLEDAGIQTYLHVPSPELLRSFLEAGSRKMVFEGRECGGHVGPRTSFVLWDAMIRVALEFLESQGPDAKGEDCHFLFAGGIHDARSAAVVAAMTAPLSERGVRVGVLVGTAYLFTTEAVATRAIQPAFQQEAILCRETVLLETGVGHATRCADTAFWKQFATAKSRQLQEGKPKEEVRNALEALNLGRLRVAAKGIARETSKDGKPEYIHVDDATQRREGMYMIGQVAALRDQVYSIAELHSDIARAGEILCDRVPPSATQSGVAIVGLSCLLPKAKDIAQYWQNICSKRNAVEEIPKERWDVELYFDADRRAKDKVYSRWGGFLEDIPFDPAKFGMPPNSVSSVEPMQLLTLEMVREALIDAGYSDRRFPRERTSVVIGTGGGVGELGLGYGFRSLIPHFVDHAGGTSLDANLLIEKLEGNLPSWTEDSFAGLLLNVVAGRVANRFDFGGTNYIVDAACATSLAALRLAVTELESGSSDVVVAGSSDMMQTPFGYLCFSKTQALSPTGQCRTFDEKADGIVISEGLAVAILKRLDDAIADGDKVYAVIKSVGASSDGRDKGLTAPRPAGQIRALERAYHQAQVDPKSVGLIEAHGTGTVVGDRTEVESLTQFFQASGTPIQTCALGSVKSLIGHTKCTAGFAGLIKAALALQHKVLPPTAGVTQPNSKANFPATPFYLNTETRPWIQGGLSPRRAGVSAFGFGGTNFHVVLEEYADPNSAPQSAPVQDWPAELFLWRAKTQAAILTSLQQVLQAIRDGANPRLADLASCICRPANDEEGPHCLAVVASDLADLSSKLETASDTVRQGRPYEDPSGVYYSPEAAITGKVAFLFPGQGSQRVNMLGDLTVAFPDLRRFFEMADEGLDSVLEQPLSRFIYPVPAWSESGQREQESALKQTRVAQPALAAADAAVYHLLKRLGVRPDMAAGHSYGEFVALYAAGCLTFRDLVRVSEARGRFIAEASKQEPGAMAAADAEESQLTEIIKAFNRVWIANLNSPSQTVISGSSSDISSAVARLKSDGIAAREIPVSCAFHSPLVAGAVRPLLNLLEEIPVLPPRFPVYSNTTAEPHDASPSSMRGLLAEHLEKPVRFADELLSMYNGGARLFIEVGPGTVLTGLVGKTLGSRPHRAIAVDRPGRSGLLQLAHALAQMAITGAPLEPHALFEGRVRQHLDVARLVEQTRPKPLSSTSWLIAAGRAVPALEAKRPPAVRATREPLLIANQTSTAPSRPMSNVAPQSVASAARSDLLAAHRQVMTRLLDTHRSVMLTALGAAAPDVSQPVSTAAIPATTASAAPPPTVEVTPARSVQPRVPAQPVEEPVHESAPQITAESVGARLIALVSARTGYPPEMLNIDLDLEADLGIDSIKRVEIVSELVNSGLLKGTSSEGDLEELTQKKTLRHIIDWIVPKVVESPANESALSTSTKLTESPETPNVSPGPTQLTRRTVRVVDAPLVSGLVDNQGTILITDDGRGLALRLASILSERGLASEVIGDTRFQNGASAVANLTDGSSVVGLVRSIRARHTRITGLVHLAALAWGDDSLDLFEQHHRFACMSLYLLARELEPDLCQPNGFLLSVTNMGGSFGFAHGGPCFPAHGGVAGFTKAIAREWDSVRTKVLDLDSAADLTRSAALIADELGSWDGQLEIGYLGSRRITLLPCADPLDAGQGTLLIDTSSVIVVTGGARGITAEIAIELARKTRAHILLVGRSQLSPLPEPEEVATYTTDRDLKAALIRRAERRGETVVPARIETEWKRVRAEREIRRTLDAVRATGSPVEYHAVDVADENQFGAFLEGIYDRLGRIDGVIHGAGVIEDKLVRDKTPESFERVHRPKVLGALVLARKLRPESLKFLAFFSSVAARFGNRGQADYAAANEAVAKLGMWLDTRWPARVVTFDWGPWQSANGMVSRELAARFQSAGVEMVHPDVGCKAFVDELSRGRKHDVEVIYGGPILTERQGGIEGPGTLPMLSDSSFAQGPDGNFSLLLQTGVATHPFLNDHRLDGVAVMPMAMMLEVFAEAAAAANPRGELLAIRELTVLSGVSYADGQTQAIRVNAAPSGGEPHGKRSLRLDAFTADRATPHYTAFADLASGRRTEERPAPLRLVNPRDLPMDLSEASREWLFHGPLMMGISSVERIGDNGIIGILSPSSPLRLLGRSVPGTWLIDPVVVDSALQLMILWARVYRNETPLPSALGAFRRFSPTPAGPLRCEVEIRQPGGAMLLANLRFIDASGELVARMDDMKVTCSAALNRLASKPVAAL